MKNKRFKNDTLIYLFLFFIFALSCKQNNITLSKKEKQIIKIEILEMFDAYHQAVKEGGLIAEFEYLEDSSNFFWVPPDYKSPLGIDSVKTILTHNTKSIKAINFSFETIQVFPISNNFANYSGIVVGKMTNLSDAETTFKIIESGSLIKSKGKWKLLSGQSRNLED